MSGKVDSTFPSGIAEIERPEFGAHASGVAAPGASKSEVRAVAWGRRGMLMESQTAMAGSPAALLS